MVSKRRQLLVFGSLLLAGAAVTAILRGHPGVAFVISTLGAAIGGVLAMRLKERIPRRIAFIVAAATFALAMIAGVGALLAPQRTSTNARRALELARLADLPDSAVAVQADGTSSMFSAGFFLRFEAAPEDIERFLADSPGLEGIAPELFTADHMYLPYRSDRSISEQHTYFHTGALPSWFDPTIRGRGRRFVIPQDTAAYHGEVIIDDEAHRVFVRGDRS
jgi:hypothetical protein